MFKMIKLTVLSIAVALNSACGFKSDLTLPEKKNNPDELFVQDGEVLLEPGDIPVAATYELEELPPLPDGILPEKPPYLPEDGEVIDINDGTVNIGSVTAQAIEGDILIDPDAEPDAENKEGVAVDLRDLVEQLEDNL